LKSRLFHFKRINLSIFVSWLVLSVSYPRNYFLFQASYAYYLHSMSFHVHLLLIASVPLYLKSISWWYHITGSCFIIQSEKFYLGFLECLVYLNVMASHEIIDIFSFESAILLFALSFLICSLFLFCILSACLWIIFNIPFHLLWWLSLFLLVLYLVTDLWKQYIYIYY
jgi:hypothetical protein